MSVFNKIVLINGLITCLLMTSTAVLADSKEDKDESCDKKQHHHVQSNQVELGPRPFYLVKGMDKGRLKKKLESCASGPFHKTDFSIGHRGAAMQFPEHTKESYEAAAKMGAGIVECDVTFTKDRELVCRHSQCDLHTTTNILATDLASRCSQPFQPAQIDPMTGKTLVKASAKCCTSDITLAEYRTLTAKMDASDPNATTVADYLRGTPDWRTDVYTGRGTLMSHKDSIALFRKLGVKYTPELKTPSVAMPYEGEYRQEDYAAQMLNEYIEAGVAPKDVYAQSFNLSDIEYWIKQYPAFGKQAVYLDGRYDDPAFDHTDPSTWSPSMDELVASHIKIIAPPMWMLLRVNAQGKIVPSVYAKAAKRAGLDIITWTFERSDLTQGAVNQQGEATWYYQTIGDAIKKDSDMYLALDVLAKKVGILGIFSDWPATVTYYGNCMFDKQKVSNDE